MCNYVVYKKAYHLLFFLSFFLSFVSFLPRMNAEVVSEISFSTDVELVAIRVADLRGSSIVILAIAKNRN